MKCPLCGAEVAKDDLYCGNCGYSLMQDKGEAPQEGDAPEATPAGGDSLATPAPEPFPQPAGPARGFALPPAPPAAPSATGRKPLSPWVIVVLVLAALFLCCCCAAAIMMFSTQSSGYYYPY